MEAFLEPRTEQTIEVFKPERSLGILAIIGEKVGAADIENLAQNMVKLNEAQLHDQRC